MTLPTTGTSAERSHRQCLAIRWQAGLLFPSSSVSSPLVWTGQAQQLALHFLASAAAAASPSEFGQYNLLHRHSSRPQHRRPFPSPIPSRALTTEGKTPATMSCWC
eukprot:3999838-Amphidinium_carterae.1